MPRITENMAMRNPHLHRIPPNTWDCSPPPAVGAHWAIAPCTEHPGTAEMPHTANDQHMNSVAYDPFEMPNLNACMSTVREVS
jgi:hypothetical protein